MLSFEGWDRKGWTEEQTALWSAVLSVVHLLKHKDHSLCLRCRVCWFSRMMSRIFTLWTISEKRFYIIFHFILPEFYLAVQKEAIQSMVKTKGIETKCLMWARLWDKGCFLVWLTILFWLPNHSWVQNLNGEIQKRQTWLYNCTYNIPAKARGSLPNKLLTTFFSKYGSSQRKKLYSSEHYFKSSSPNFFKRKIHNPCKSFLPGLLIWPPLLGLVDWSSFIV